MNFNYKSCLLMLGGICLTVSISTSTNALENDNLNVTANSALLLTQNTKANDKADSREYTFKAPDSKKIVNTEKLVKVRGYKVEVYGSEQELLQQVKDIEPGAFIKDDRIQVGIFSQEDNAQNLVQKLAIKGFWARIKTMDVN